MQEKPKYIICPRCELNYIKEQDELCNVCKAELGLLGKNYLIPEDELEAESGKLCPICHVNYIDEDEEMCIICKKVKEAKELESLCRRARRGSSARRDIFGISCRRGGESSGRRGNQRLQRSQRFQLRYRSSGFRSGRGRRRRGRRRGRRYLASGRKIFQLNQYRRVL